MSRKLELIVLAIVLIFAVQFIYMSSTTDAEYGGADGEAKDMINEITDGYEPIANPIWEPPSGEIESLLFGLQAAIGAGSSVTSLAITKPKKTMKTNLGTKKKNKSEGDKHSL